MVVMCSIRGIITIVIIADMAHLAILMNGDTLMDIIITAILIIRGIIMMDIVERNKEVDIMTTNRNEYIFFCNCVCIPNVGVGSQFVFTVKRETNCCFRIVIFCEKTNPCLITFHITL